VSASITMTLSGELFLSRALNFVELHDPAS
jgi:hypothetical protein